MCFIRPVKAPLPLDIFFCNWRYINNLFTYLLTYLLTYVVVFPCRVNQSLWSRLSSVLGKRQESHIRNPDESGPCKRNDEWPENRFRHRSTNAANLSQPGEAVRHSLSDAWARIVIPESIWIPISRTARIAWLESDAGDGQTSTRVPQSSPR